MLCVAISTIKKQITKIKIAFNLKNQNTKNEKRRKKKK